MAEPILYTLLQRFQTGLQAIVADGGTTYWYTPALVLITVGGIDPRLYDASVSGPIYAVARGVRNTKRRDTGDSVNGDRPAATVEVVVLVSQRYAPEAPGETPDAALVVERMVRDVHRAFGYVDPGLGATVNADDIYADDGAHDEVVQDAPMGWVAGKVAFIARYDYFSSAP